MSENIVNLDVREELRSGREPFAKIMSTVAQLRPDENLRLLAPFEPVPLFHVLARQGFDPAPRQMAGGDWEVLFTRNGKADDAFNDSRRNPAPAMESEIRHSKSEIVTVDARGLEPPQPMVKTLEALAALPDGATLRAHTDRRPIHLYAQLESRGFTGHSEEQSDGSYITIIRRS